MWILLFFSYLSLTTTPGHCAGLTPQQQESARRLFSKLYPHACCDQTLEKCLAQKEVDRLSSRLASNICHRLAQGQDQQRITRALSRRARTMLMLETPSLAKEKTIAIANAAAAGDPTAPVTVVAYGSGRGPNCARLLPKLHAAVTSGPLKGKVKLHLRLFPLRSQPFSKQASLGFLAAGRQHKFWQFALYSYGHFDAFTLEQQLVWAELLGLQRTRFTQDLADPELSQLLLQSKREGLENGVNSTPTIFIENQKYAGELSIEELVDTLLEVYDLKIDRQCHAPPKQSSGASGH